MIHVRRARDADSPDLLRLLGQLGYAEDAAAEALGSVLADPAHVVLVAVDGDRVLGYVNVNFRIQLHHAAEVATLDELVVAAGCRGDGIGGRLVDEVVALARRRGARRVEAASALAREGAHRFYERLGFERTSLKFVRELDEG